MKRMGEKLLIAVLSVSLFGSVAVPGYTVNARETTGSIYTEIFESGSGSAEDPYLIKDAEQLMSFADSMNEEVDYTGITVALANDIDVSDKNWHPIGGAYAFNGTFDGNGFAIKGAHAGSEESPYKLTQADTFGIFGNLGFDSVVKDLKAEDIDFNISSDATAYVGGIAGYMAGVSDNGIYRGSVINNVHVTGNISLDTDDGNTYAGGIAAYMYKGAIVNSTVDAKVSCKSDGVDSLAEAGSIAGLVNRGLIANNASYGSVLASGNRDEAVGDVNEGMGVAGAIAGLNSGTLVNNYAGADVTVKEYTIYAGMISGWITGHGKAYRNWYSGDAKMEHSGSVVSKLQPYGTLTSRGISDEDFTKYAGGLVYDLIEVPEKDVQKIADDMNNAYKKFPAEITAYGLDADGLSKWEYAENRLAPTGDKVRVTYAQPDIENVSEEDKVMQDGTWYGRSKDKSTVVAITVKDGVVTAAESLKGETHGEKYDDAEKYAEYKALYGDFSKYEKPDTSFFGGGNGTKEDPYLIEDEAQLRYLAQSINEDVDWKGVYFRQTSDIELSDKEWLPIGWAVEGEFDDGFAYFVGAYPFSGNFDGAGYSIKNLKIASEEGISRTATNALFGYTMGDKAYEKVTLPDESANKVEIKNVHLENVQIDAKGLHHIYAAPLIGFAEKGTFVDGCSAEGSVSGASGYSFGKVGGLIANMLRGSVVNSWSDVELKGTNSKEEYIYAGGLLGSTERVMIVNSFALGDIYVDTRDANKADVGGIVGMEGGIIVNCYADCDITSKNTSSSVGAVAGCVAAISTEKYGYFDKDTVLTAAGKKLPLRYYGVAWTATDEEKADMQSWETDTKSDDFAKTLNKNVSDMGSIMGELREIYAADENGNSKYHSMYYNGDGSDLSRWGCADGKVILAAGSKDEPVKPDDPAEPAEPGKGETPAEHKEAYTSVSFPATDGTTVTLSRNNVTGVYTDAEGDIAVVISTNEISAPDKKGNAKAETSAHYSYTGKKLKPGFKSYVVIDGIAYVYGKDYKVSVKGGLHAGKLTAVYKFKKNAAVYKSGIKKITQNTSVEAKTVTAEDVSVKLNKKRTKVVSITDTETKKKISKKNYTVDMSARTVTFKGDYAGTVKF